MNTRILPFIVNSLSANSKKYYLIDGAFEDNSIIKMWFTVLALLDDYDNNRCSGFEVSFNCNGKYYEPSRGSNWWKYYFAFNIVGLPKQDVIVRVPRYQRSILRFKTVCTMSAERGNFLLNKYMKLQEAMQVKLDQIRRTFFNQNVPVVGVYYQKPIMSEVQQSWSPIALSERVKEEIREIGNCKICLFTHQKEFVDVFEKEFGEQLVLTPFLKNSENTSKAEEGENELLTLLLLSSCDLVIAPGSYQGIGAKMLNPKLKLVQLDIIPYAQE